MTSFFSACIKLSFSFIFYLIIADVIEMDYPIQAEFKVVKQKGLDSIIIVDELGFTYSCSNNPASKRNPNTRTWRCSKKNKRCTATITTENTWIVAKNRFHNHEPMASKVVRAEFAQPGDQIVLDFIANH